MRAYLNNGVEREDWTDVGTIGVFRHQARFDLRSIIVLRDSEKTK